jgi:hypothetical protein
MGPTANSSAKQNAIFGNGFRRVGSSRSTTLSKVWSRRQMVLWHSLMVRIAAWPWSASENPGINQVLCTVPFPYWLRGHGARLRCIARAAHASFLSLFVGELSSSSFERLTCIGFAMTSGMPFNLRNKPSSSSSGL